MARMSGQWGGSQHSNYITSVFSQTLAREHLANEFERLAPFQKSEEQTALMLTGANLARDLYEV